MSAAHRELTVFERLFVRALVGLMSRVIGDKNHHDYAVAAETVRHFGVRGFFRYMKFVSKFVQQIEPVFGEANTQTLIGVSSFLAGCGYCGYGHALAGALILFRDTGKLHPLHPHSIAPLFDFEDQEVIERLDELLAEPDYADLRRQVNRMYRIYIGELDPSTEEDRLLKATVDFWCWTLECSIVEGVKITPDDSTSPHPVGGDRKLVARYQKARAAERAALTASA